MLIRIATYPGHNDTTFSDAPCVKNAQKFLHTLLQNATGFYKFISTQQHRVLIMSEDFLWVSVMRDMYTEEEEYGLTSTT